MFGVSTRVASYSLTTDSKLSMTTTTKPFYYNTESSMPIGLDLALKLPPLPKKERRKDGKHQHNIHFSSSVEEGTIRG